MSGKRKKRPWDILDEVKKEPSSPKKRRLENDELFKLFLKVIMLIITDGGRHVPFYNSEKVLRNIINYLRNKSVSKNLQAAYVALKSVSVENLDLRDLANRQKLRSLKRFKDLCSNISLTQMYIPDNIYRLIEPVVDVLLDMPPISGFDDITHYIYCDYIQYDQKYKQSEIDVNIARDAQELEYLLRFHPTMSKEIAERFDIKSVELLNLLQDKISFLKINKHKTYKVLARLLKLLTNHLNAVFDCSSISTLIPKCFPRQREVMKPNFNWIKPDRRGKYQYNSEQKILTKDREEAFLYFRNNLKDFDIRDWSDSKLEQRMLVLEDVDNQRFQVISRIAYILKRYRERIKNILGRDARIKFRGSLVRGLKGYPKQGIPPNFDKYDCDAFIEVSDQWWHELKKMRPKVVIPDPHANAYRTKRLRDYESLSTVQTSHQGSSRHPVSQIQEQEEKIFSKKLQQLVEIENDIRGDLKLAKDEKWLKGYAELPNGEIDFEFYIRPESSVKIVYEERNPYLPRQISARGYPRLAKALQEQKSHPVREFREDAKGLRKHSLLAIESLDITQPTGITLPEYQIVIGCREWYLEDYELFRWRMELHAQRRMQRGYINYYDTQALQQLRKNSPVGEPRENRPMYNEPLPLVRGDYPNQDKVPKGLKFSFKDGQLPFTKRLREGK